MLRLGTALLCAAVLGLSACGHTPAGPGDIESDSTTTLPPAVDSDVVSVPDLTGLRLAEARLLLDGTGLELMAQPDAIDEAIVVAQDPANGDLVDVGTVVIVDAREAPTCNAPDPLAPAPGEVIITVLFECGGSAVAPTRGIGVPRIVPDSTQPVDRIEWTLRSLLAGPTADERAVGFESAFDEKTADALNGVTLADGHLIVDFNDAIIVNNMNTATGMVFFQAELKRNVFQHPEVETVEFRFHGDCDAWSALFESDGCQVISRADWDAELAASNELLREPDLPEGARDALMAYWDSLPSAPGIEHRITRVWQGQSPAEGPSEEAPPMEVWCVEAEISSTGDPSVDGSRMVWIVMRGARETSWSAALLASLSSTWPYQACGTGISD